MKTYIVDWYNKTRNGAWRDYRKVVQTDDIKSHITNKMKLTIASLPCGHSKGVFASATEVCTSDKFGYAYKTVAGGEYWFVKDDKMVSGVCKWDDFYDYRLKRWMVGRVLTVNGLK